MTTVGKELPQNRGARIADCQASATADVVDDLQASEGVPKGASADRLGTEESGSMLRHAQLCVVLTCAWLMPMNGRCPMNISLRSTVGSGALHELTLAAQEHRRLSSPTLTTATSQKHGRLLPWTAIRQAAAPEAADRHAAGT